MSAEKPCPTCTTMLKIKVEKLSPQPGDLVVFKVPAEIYSDVLVSEVQRALDGLGASGKFTLVIAPDYYDVETIKMTVAVKGETGDR